LSLPAKLEFIQRTGQPIIAGVGRFGPYVKHDKTYANLEDGDDVLNVGPTARSH
jgi:DNA topoisomerase-1